MLTEECLGMSLEIQRMLLEAFEESYHQNCLEYPEPLGMWQEILGGYGMFVLEIEFQALQEILEGFLEMLL